MSEANRESLRTIWRQLAQRNEWKLVEDETAFLEQAAAEYAALTDKRSPSQRQRVAVSRAYSALLYHGLRSNSDEAARELRMAFVRTSLRDRWQQAEAEELAQETIFRVLDRLDAVKSPLGFLAWAFGVFRTARSDSRKKNRDEQPLQDDRDELTYEPADPRDIAAEIDQRVDDRDLLALIRSRLANDRQWVTLFALAVFGDNPRDVANALGVPPYLVRMAKSRALKRLREDEDLIRQLRERAGDISPAAAPTGANSDA